ncbi:MAG: hypothetical protein MJ106_04310 [Lentisphaeria bacterium]|nr:hypothetical protein [Lentisphaeria bacterium]
MLKKKNSLFVVFCVLFCTILCTAGEKKLIAHSWDLLWVTPQQICDNIEALEALPLDGIAIRCYARKDDGELLNFTSAMDSEPWRKEWLEYMLPSLKRICGGRLTDNFLTTFWNPKKRIPWDDDVRWEAVARNFGLAAWLAKECGARGLLMDSEDYPKTQQYFFQPALDGDSYHAAAALARKRGAQLMAAIGREYPDGVILSFWLFTMNPELYMSDASSKSVEESGNLWIPFLNGMLDAIPSDFTLVDATENGYYFHAEKMEFIQAGYGLTRHAVKLVSPENRTKFFSQVKVGFGFYMDMYTNDEFTNGKQNIYYMPPKDGSRLKALAANLTQGMECADEYCWLYGEKFNWIAWDYKGQKGKVDPTWEEKLPNVYRVLQRLREPRNTLQEDFRQASANGALVDIMPAESSADWGFWSRKMDVGSRVVKDGCMNFTGVSAACAVLDVPHLKSSCVYAVQAWAKGQGKLGIRVRWKKDGEWVFQEKDVLVNFGAADAEGWRMALEFVTVPEGANMMSILLYADQTAEESCVFRRPQVFDMDLP